MYVFYDFETTGLNPAFEQALQFAAIQTDNDFNEIDIVNERCQLRKDVIPSPQAMAITGMTPDIISDPSLRTDYEFSLHIGELISRWAPSVFTGYNTISFDEEFLRHSFYHNLHPNIYKTQFDGNSRFDVMNAVTAISVLYPQAITVPTNAKGNSSFKLDQLAPANGFQGHHAHDALGDVRATIYMAAFIRKNAPNVWQMMVRNSDKNQVSRLLTTKEPVFVIERNFGNTTTYPACYCVVHPNNASEYAVIDLSKAGIIELLGGGSDADIDKALNASPRMIRRIKVNAHPIIFGKDEFNNYKISPDQQRLAELISNNLEFQKRVAAALKRRSDAYEPFPYTEQRIYEGFPSAQDKSILQQLNSVDIDKKAELIRSLQCQRLHYLGQKLLWLYAPHKLSAEEFQIIESDIRARWNSNLPLNDKQLLWSSVQAVKSEIAEIEASQKMDSAALAQWKQFYADRFGISFDL
jgi:exodeoxyribonuclease-1